MPPDEPRSLHAGMVRADALYDRDYVAWADEQARRLRQAFKSGAMPDVDWERLIEEVEDLGNRHRDALESNLARIIEHLLKLEHSPAAAPRAGWERTVLEHRLRAAKLLRRNPSLKREVARLTADAFDDARELAVDALACDGVATSSIPAACPYQQSDLLDRAWLPAKSG